MSDVVDIAKPNGVVLCNVPVASLREAGFIPVIRFVHSKDAQRPYEPYQVVNANGVRVRMPGGPFDSDRDVIDWLVELGLAELEEEAS